MRQEMFMDKPITRPMDRMRKHPKVTELVKRSRGYITDLSGKHKIQLDWHLNEQSDRDHVFKMTVDDKKVYIDLEELMFYTRVFF